MCAKNLRRNYELDIVKPWMQIKYTSKDEVDIQPIH